MIQPKMENTREGGINMLKKLRQNHFMKKSITILCIIVMLFCFIPVNVFATTIRQELQKEENAEVITEDNILELQEELNQEEQTSNAYKTKEILKEEIEKRTTNEKHFLLEDGTEVATIYPANQHEYTNKNSRWK